jgi:hypothetical protein
MLQPPGKLRQGSQPSRAPTRRNHHHRQLTHILHLPPATRRADLLLVLRCSRQRADGLDPSSGRPGDLASPRCEPGVGRGVVGLRHEL